MLYIVLGGIIGISLGIIWGIMDEDSVIECILQGLAGSIMGGIIGIAVWIFVGGFIGFFLPTVDVAEEQAICALSDSSTIEGRSFLFSGYIDGKFVCRYVIETERGKHIEEVDADDVYIHEGDYEPTVKVHSLEFRNVWYNLFAVNFIDGYYVEFYVPKDTVTSEYKIDLQ